MSGKDIDEYKNKIHLLKTEIEDMKTATQIYTVQKDEEMTQLKDNYDYELNLLRKIINEYLDDVTITSHEKEALLNEKKELEKRLEVDHHPVGISSGFRDNKQNYLLENVLLKPLRKVTSLGLSGGGHNYPLLGGIIAPNLAARSIKNCQTPVTPRNSRPSSNRASPRSGRSTVNFEEDDQDDIETELEISMQQAKEEADKLKSIVLPLETEISHLKNELRYRELIIQNYFVSPASDDIVANNELNYRRRIFPLDSIIQNISKPDVRSISLPSLTKYLDSHPHHKTTFHPNLPTLNLKRLKRFSSHHDLNFDNNMSSHTNIYLEHSPFSNEKGSSFGNDRLRRPTPKVLWRKQEPPSPTILNDSRLHERANNILPFPISPSLSPQIVALNRENELLREDFKRERLLREELEERFDSYANNMREKMSVLVQEIKESETRRDKLKIESDNTRLTIEQEIEELVDRMERLKIKMGGVLNENSILLGKHSVKSQEMQDKMIDLPNNVEDLQIYMLKLGEDHIAALIAKEYCEEQSSQRLLALTTKLNEEIRARKKMETQQQQPHQQLVSSENMTHSTPIESNIFTTVDLDRSRIKDNTGSVSDATIDKVLSMSPEDTSLLSSVIVEEADANNSKKCIKSLHGHLLPSPIKPVPINLDDNVKLEEFHKKSSLLDDDNTSTKWSPSSCPGCGVSFFAPNDHNDDKNVYPTTISICQKCGKGYCFNCISRRTLVSKDSSSSSFLKANTPCKNDSIPPASVIKVCEECYHTEMHV